MDRLACDRMFVAVVDGGSFSAAAERLGTSSGQASKLVARLEAELGVRLLNRSTRALSLTDAGRGYHARIRAVLDEIDEIDRAMGQEGQVPTGRIRLTAPLSFGVGRLAPALDDFARTYPDITLDVQFSDRVANLVEEGFDIALRIGHLADSTLIARRLARIRVLCLAAPDYLSARGTPLHPRDLSDHDAVADSNFREGLQWTFPAPGGPVTGHPRLRMTYSNADACLHACAAGLGITRLPDFVASAALAEGRVVELLPAFEDTPLPIWVLYPPTRQLAVKIRVLVDFLIERFGTPE